MDSVFSVDWSSFSAGWRTFWLAVSAILSRERGVIEQLYSQPGVLELSFLIVTLAGLSERLGQSVILFVNEVRPYRFVISILLGAALFLGGYVIWVASIWIVARFAFGVDDPLRLVVGAVGLGYAPLLFGFLGLIPYFGTGILTILYFWVFTAIVSAVSLALDLQTWQAVLVSTIGGTMILLMRATVGRPLVRLARQVRSAVAGQPMVFKVQQAVDNRDMESLITKRTEPTDEEV